MKSDAMMGEMRLCPRDYLAELLPVRITEMSITSSLRSKCLIAGRTYDEVGSVLRQSLWDVN